MLRRAPLRKEHLSSVFFFLKKEKKERKETSSLTESILRPLLFFPTSLGGDAFCPFLAFTAQCQELGATDLGRLLARLVCLAACREVESPGKPDMESAVQELAAQVAVLRWLLFCSHVHVPTWKEISR